MSRVVWVVWTTMAGPGGRALATFVDQESARIYAREDSSRYLSIPRTVGNYPEIQERSPRCARAPRGYSIDSCGEAVWDPALPERG